MFVSGRIWIRNGNRIRFGLGLSFSVPYFFPCSLELHSLSWIHFCLGFLPTWLEIILNRKHFWLSQHTHDMGPRPWDLPMFYPCTPCRGFAPYQSVVVMLCLLPMSLCMPAVPARSRTHVVVFSMLCPCTPCRGLACTCQFAPLFSPRGEFGLAFGHNIRFPSIADFSETGFPFGSYRCSRK